MTNINSSTSANSGSFIGNRLLWTAIVLIVPMAVIAYLHIDMINEKSQQTSASRDSVQTVTELYQLALSVYNPDNQSVKRTKLPAQTQAILFQYPSQASQEIEQLMLSPQLFHSSIQAAPAKAMFARAFASLIGVTSNQPQLRSIQEESIYRPLDVVTQELLTLLTDTNVAVANYYLVVSSEQASQIKTHIVTSSASLNQLSNTASELKLKLMRNQYLGDKNSVFAKQVNSIISKIDHLIVKARKNQESHKRWAFFNLLSEQTVQDTEAITSDIVALEIVINWQITEISLELLKQINDQLNQQNNHLQMQRLAVLILVFLTALFASLLGYYITKSNRLAHLHLAEQNSTLEGLVSLRVEELEHAKKEAEQQANQAEIAKTTAENLNTKLSQQIAKSDELAQKAEAANKAKSRFLANMSHEIRTPMNAIIGLSRMVLEDNNLPEHQSNHVRRVYQSAQSLLGILNDILDFSKIEAGKLELEETEFEFEQVFAHLNNIAAIRAEEKHLELCYLLDAEIPKTLVGDPLRLGQILVNLVYNAIKFTEHGHILISVEVLSRRGETIQLKFSVKDTGIGMDQHQQGLLFRAFTQADSSTTRRFGGTGLGLAITNSLVHKMNGQIEVNSQPNAGSTFTFTATFNSKSTTEHLLEKNKLALSPTRWHLLSKHKLLSRKVTEISQYLDYELHKFGDFNHLDTDDHDLVLLDLHSTALNDEFITAIQKFKQQHPNCPLFCLRSANHAIDSQPFVDTIQPTIVLDTPLLTSDFVKALQSLAMSEQEKQKQVQAADERTEFPDKSVLLVEDNEINQIVAKSILENAKLNVDVAENGKVAVEKAKQKQYDVILMDIQMPVMDGYQATALIHRDQPNTTIIAMTAHATTGDREHCLAAGMEDHIAKPIDVEALLKSLREVLH